MEDQRSVKNLGWPVVALVGLSLAAFLGLFALIPADEPAARTMLLTIVSSGSSAIVMWFVQRKTKETANQVAEVQKKVETVEKLVNGNTNRLIDKLPEPHRGEERQRIADQHSEWTNEG